VLVLLCDAPDGLAIRDVFDQLAADVPPTSVESQDRLTSPGVSRYEVTIRNATSELVKAGWLTKSAGTWRVTDKGRAAVSRFSDPVEFYRAAVRRRDPMLMAPSESPPSDVGDIFAGCFLSLAGALVGSVIGTIVLLMRMLPDLSLGLVGGFAAAFIVGVVVGLLATFPIASLAVGFGRRAESIWLYGTAFVAAISAAVTPSLLIAVNAAG